MGSNDGARVGRREGSIVGICEGLRVGLVEGTTVVGSVGENEGAEDGSALAKQENEELSKKLFKKYG